MIDKPLHTRDTVATAERQAWMATLARAPLASLRAGWDALAAKPAYETLRGPATGLVMLRGRAGGDGAAFNLGEATVTRCTVRIEAGAIGHSYALGRDREKAVLAAVFDALLQDDRRRHEIMQLVVEPVRSALRTARERESRKVAATRVDFLTVAREAGE